MIGVGNNILTKNNSIESADGSVILLRTTSTPAGLYKSLDYGGTWTRLSTISTYNKMSIAADGLKMVFSRTGAYPAYSTDGGVTVIIPPYGTFSNSGAGEIYTMITNNGQYAYNSRTYNSYNYRSVNSGVSWLPTSGISAIDGAFAASYDGQYVYWIRGSTTMSMFPRKSTNYGASFDAMTNYTTLDVGTIICSSDGKDIYINLASTNLMKVSTDYGATFSNSITLPVTSHAYADLNSQQGTFDGSATCQYMILCTMVSYSSYPVLLTNDYGATWSTISDSGYNCKVFVSATGQYMYYTSSLGLYKSDNYGASFSLITNATIGSSNFDVITSNKVL